MATEKGQGPVYYIAQERAFAPGIAGEWPEVIKAPHSKHGRLVRRFGDVDRLTRERDALLEALKEIVGHYDSVFGGNTYEQAIAAIALTEGK
jgi:hypothetical protein